MASAWKLTARRLRCRRASACWAAAHLLQIADVGAREHALQPCTDDKQVTINVHVNLHVCKADGDFEAVAFPGPCAGVLFTSELRPEVRPYSNPAHSNLALVACAVATRLATDRGMPGPMVLLREADSK